MEPSTRDILVEFMNTRLAKRGHRSLPKLSVARNGHRRNQSSYNRSRDYRRSLYDICQILNEMSSELQEFISNTHHDKFREALEIIDLEEPDYGSLGRLADTLFCPDISWFHILTFLHYGAELACKGFEAYYNNDEQGYEMVYRIIDWMCEYIDGGLIDWIKGQGGWMSIKDYKEYKEDEYKSVRPKYSTFLGIAALAVVTGGLYLCSKFNGQ